MFCPNCGTEITGSEKFCPNCGTDLSARAEQPTTVVPPVMDETVVQPRPEATVQQPMPQPAPPMSDDFAQQTVPPVEDVPVQPTVQQRPVQAPPQPTYEPAPAPAPAPATGPESAASTPNEPTPWYATTPARIGMLVIGLALIVSGVLKIVGVFDKKPAEKPAVTAPVSTTDSTTDVTSFVPDPTSSAPDTSSTGGGFTPDTTSTTPAPTPTDTSSTTPTPTDTSSPNDTTTTSGQKDYAQGRDTSFLSNADLLDAKGNPTFYAFTQLEGWQVETLAQKQGFSWYTQDGRGIWLNASDTSAWMAMTTEGTLTDDEIAKLAPGGTGRELVYGGILSGYASPKDLYASLCKCVTVCSAAAPDGSYMAIFYGPSMTQYLAHIVDAQDGDYEFDLYNTEAIAKSYFDVAADGTYGTTMEEVFKNYTGKTTDTHE